jgi:hypothetical protein
MSNYCLYPGWVTMYGVDGKVVGYASPNVFEALKKQAAGKTAKMVIEKGENGMNVVSFLGIPIRNVDTIDTDPPPPIEIEKP